MLTPIESPKSRKEDTEEYSPFRRLMTVYTSVLILAIWAVASVFYATQLSSVQLDLIYGSIQAITFAAVGAGVVGWILNTRLGVAERRAMAAERLAEQHRSEAAKGRALAAALQASDVPDGSDFAGSDIRRQQAEFSRRLFGDLVVPSASGEGTSVRSL